MRLTHRTAHTAHRAMAVVSLQAVVAHAPPARCFQRRRLSVVAMAGSSPPPSEPKKPKKPSGPGNAPLRMQTDEQRKLGYGGDDSGGAAKWTFSFMRLSVRCMWDLCIRQHAIAGGRGGGGGDGWEPGGNDDGVSRPHPHERVIHLVPSVVCVSARLRSQKLAQSLTEGGTISNLFCRPTRSASLCSSAAVSGRTGNGADQGES